MVSLLEQYETETQQSNDISGDDLNNPFRSGYIKAASSDNEEMFKKQRIQIDLQGRPIDQLEKRNGQMAILLKPKFIRLLHIETGSDEILEAPDQVDRIFLDPTGKHLLVATTSKELYYYSRSSKKFRSISKLKGNLVTAVGWNKSANEKSTDAILVGTKKGLIFELAINTSNEGFLNQNIDSYCKQVYSLKETKVSQITGIEVFHLKIDNPSASNNIENIYDIVVSTGVRLYEFIGSDASPASGGSSSSGSQSSLLSASGNRVNSALAATSASLSSMNPLTSSSSPVYAFIFAYYESKPIHELANFYEMPANIGVSHSMGYPYGCLQVRTSAKTKKKTLAWMSTAGILTYEFDLAGMKKFAAGSTSNESNKRLIHESNQNIINYPQSKNEHDDADELSTGICLTEFHVAIFFKFKVKIVCLLNNELVYNQKSDTMVPTLGVWYDPYFGDFGCYTRQSIIQYIPNKESRKIWKIYMSKNEFELAKQYCRDNPANLNTVLTRQAEYLFTNKKYNESAIYYAQTQNSFEEICLKYLELGDLTALRTFLSNKLNTLDVENEVTQTTVVIAYIIEIFLNQLSDLLQEKLYDEHRQLQKEFYKFLQNPKIRNGLKESKDAIYKIFSSHGNTDDLVFFAEAMNDYPQIIIHYIQEENYRKALEALAKQKDTKIIKKYSPIFFELLPKEMVDLWINYGNLLKPVDLLPSLASFSHNEEQPKEAIRYLEYCVNRLNSDEQSIHNNLLSLYLQYNPEKFLEYVKDRKDGSNIYFDILMIARLCTQRSNKYLNEACVYLYKIMGWYEEAVDLALGVNVDLARDVANSLNSSFDLNINHSDEVKKVLWLRIARHVIEKENDVNKAMSFLHELSDAIAIEDVLPYFPDFVTIDQFKDAIRTSLGMYTEKIQTLKTNIDQAASSAQLIRREIQSIRQKSITVNVNDQCSHCRYRLMTRRFYVFPCSHKFHADCLYQTSQPYLKPSRQRRIDELQKLLQDIQTIPNAAGAQAPAPGMAPSSSGLVGSVASGVTNAITHFSKSSTRTAQSQTYSHEEIIRLKSELDELLAYECPWCGERILRSIDEPFIDPKNYEEVYKSWL